MGTPLVTIQEAPSSVSTTWHPWVQRYKPLGARNSMPYCCQHFKFFVLHVTCVLSSMLGCTLCGLLPRPYRRAGGCIVHRQWRALRRWWRS